MADLAVVSYLIPPESALHVRFLFAFVCLTGQSSASTEHF